MTHFLRLAYILNNLKSYNQAWNLQFPISAVGKKSGGANSNNEPGKPPHITKSGGAKTWFFWGGLGSLPAPLYNFWGGLSHPKPPLRDLHPCLQLLIIYNATEMFPKVSNLIFAVQTSLNSHNQRHGPNSGAVYLYLP